jgi:TonB-dependent SusC/RagA subfamily outer membrane receptor
MRLKQAILFAVILLLGAVNVTFAQVKISGKVKSKVTGEGLSGATILLKGTTLSSVTDVKGEFTISTPEKGGTLTVSYAGMKTVDIKVTNETKVLEIILDETIGNEVVVVGYGTKKRKDLSTSVSSVSAKEINATPVADAAQALQGRVSGVTITQNSGAPGGTGGTRIRIRGISSITGTNNPLIVVDGYPLPDQNADNVLNSFGTGDIESIDVLKDAAAASIYGQRASNGVIMITTKRGKPGKASLTDRKSVV